MSGGKKKSMGNRRRDAAQVQRALDKALASLKVVKP